jgi:hypothetical protein
MVDAKLFVHLPVDKPLKVKEKEELIAELLSAFKSERILDAKVIDSYYSEERALSEPLSIVFVILTAMANIATIAMAVRTFLRNRNVKKEITLTTETLKLTIKGNMSDRDIVKLVKEYGKIAREREE